MIVTIINLFILITRIYYFILSLQEKGIGFVDKNDFWFSTDLYLLYGPEYDLTVYPRVCLYVCNIHFVGALLPEPMNGVFRFWYKLLNMWHCYSTFFTISGVAVPREQIYGISSKFIYC